MVKRLSIFLLLTFLISGYTDTDNRWLKSYSEALEMVEKDEKPLLIYFSGSDWCKPCMLLSREVLETEEFRNFSRNNLVLFKADFPRLKKNQLPSDLVSQNEELAEQYNPDGAFPLLVLVDAQGNVLTKAGYKQGGPEFYIDLFGKKLNP